MGGVWRWIFFSHGFQLAFTFKTVVKALDRDLHFVQCYIWGNTPTFCAHVIVSNLLWLGVVGPGGGSSCAAGSC